MGEKRFKILQDEGGFHLHFGHPVYKIIDLLQTQLRPKLLNTIFIFINFFYCLRQRHF